MIDHFEALVRQIKTGIAEMSEQQKHLKVFFTTDENLENIYVKQNKRKKVRPREKNFRLIFILKSIMFTSFH